MADLYPALLTITEGPAIHAHGMHDASVNREAMGDYVEWIQASHCSEGLFVLGSTGAGPILPWTQQREALSVVRDRANQPVVVMAGPPLPRAAFLEKLSWLRSHQFTAIALLPPLYYDFPSDAQVLTMVEAAQSWWGDVWLYNIPARVGYSLTHETVARIVDTCPNVVGIKDSSGDTSNVPVWRQIFGRGRVFCGAEPVAVASLLTGADGLVSQYASVLPEVGRVLATDGHPQRLDIQASLSRLAQRSAHLPLMSLLTELGYQRGIVPRRAQHPWPALQDAAAELVQDWLALNRAAASESGQKGPSAQPCS